MRYSIIRQGGIDFIKVIMSDQARHYFEELIFPVYRKEVADAVVIEDGLEVVSIARQNEERVNIYKVYETHPLFNYPLIDDNMSHEVVDDRLMVELAYAVVDQLKR